MGSRMFALAFLTVAMLPAVAAAQRAPQPDCTNSRGDYIACALHAGRVPDLRDGYFAQHEREVRFWTVSGMFFPEHVLIIRQRGDTVSGRLLLIWPDGMMNDSFARTQCTDQSWTTATGSLCVGRLAATPDWRAVLRELDANRLSELPDNPVPREPCWPSAWLTPSGEPGELLCSYTGDGFMHSIEVRTASVYWRYAFQNLPDTTASALARDRAILRQLRCVGAKLGDGPC